jgi:hypothetical protein
MGSASFGAVEDIGSVKRVQNEIPPLRVKNIDADAARSLRSLHSGGIGRAGGLSDVT